MSDRKRCEMVSSYMCIVIKYDADVRFSSIPTAIDGECDPTSYRSRCSSESRRHDQGDCGFV